MANAFLFPILLLTRNGGRMRHRALVLIIATIGCVILGNGGASAQDPPARLEIRNVTLNPADGLLTVTGTGFGQNPVVTLDGQKLAVLPGWSDTRIEAIAPVLVVAVPGTYRLTVADAARQATDTFVVAVVRAGEMAVGTGASEAAGAAAGGVAVSAVFPGAVAKTAQPVPIGPLSVIEDPGTPFRTALGNLALANTTGSWNTGIGWHAGTANTNGFYLTALGYSALQANISGVSNTGVGALAMAANTTGAYNTAVGAASMYNSGNAQWNAAFGIQALYSVTANNFNSAFGANALYSTTGPHNTAFGYQAGYNATNGGWNVYFGSQVQGVAGESNTMRLGLPYASGSGQNRTFIAGIRGTSVPNGLPVVIDANGQLGTGEAIVGESGSPYRTALGYQALANTTGMNGTAVGFNAGTANTTGNSLTAVGSHALELNTSGNSNTGMGTSSLSKNTVGYNNTAVGANSLLNNVDGIRNVAVGTGALTTNASGSDNAALGTLALYNNTGGNNAALGYQAGYSATNGAWNIYLGSQVVGSAGEANTMRLGLPYASGNGQNRAFMAGVRGISVPNALPVVIDAAGQLGTSEAVPIAESASPYRTALGDQALAVTTAGGATAVGYRAAQLNTTGANLTAIGSFASAGNTTGSNNTSVGAAALATNSDGSDNTAVGARSMFTNGDGVHNAAFGRMALYSNNSGSYNSVVGSQALMQNTGGNNTALGYQAGYSATNGAWNIYLGSQVIGAAAEANTIRLGRPYALGDASGQNRTFVSGIVESPLSAGAAVVGVNVDGRLGTLAPELLPPGPAGPQGPAGAAGPQGPPGPAGGVQDPSAPYRTALGSEALGTNTTGTYNTALGFQAGSTTTMEHANSFIGALSAGAAGIGNATAIGYRAKVTQSNALVLGSVAGVNGATASTSVGIGTTAPVTTFHSAASAAPGAFFDVYSDSLGALPVVYRAARGTPTAPAAVQTHDILGGLAVRAYGTTAFSGGRGQMMYRAAENWTDTAQGTYLQLTTTPLGGTDWVERVRVDPSGNVGIGTATPNVKLQVLGDLKVGASGTDGCLMNFAGTAIAGTCSSDARLKTNIQPFGPVLDRLARLRPVHYTWKVEEFPSYHFGPGNNSGLVAQEVEEVFPELVATDEHGYKMVNYSEVPLLTLAAVRELQVEDGRLKAEGERLRAENNLLKAQLAALSARLTRLEKNAAGPGK